MIVLVAVLAFFAGAVCLYLGLRKMGMRKAAKTMDIILAVVYLSLAVFTVVMIWLFTRYGMIPDTLCNCVFAALGGECGIMGWIKTSKVRHEDRQWMKEDREEARKDGGQFD